jgi:hypothetical protein
MYAPSYPQLGRSKVLGDSSAKPTRKQARTQRSPLGRSATTNGTELVAGVDGRTKWVRRMRDLIGLYLDDLGGTRGRSQAQLSMVRRIAALTIELERLETGFATAHDTDKATVELYQRTSNTLRRLLESVGLGIQNNQDPGAADLPQRTVRVVVEARPPLTVGVGPASSAIDDS